MWWLAVEIPLILLMVYSQVGIIRNRNIRRHWERFYQVWDAARRACDFGMFQEMEGQARLYIDAYDEWNPWTWYKTWGNYRKIADYWEKVSPNPYAWMTYVQETQKEKRPN